MCFTLKHVNMYFKIFYQSFSKKDLKLFSVFNMGLHAHLSFVNYTHNSSSAISRLSFCSVHRGLHITHKVIECRILGFAFFSCQSLLAASPQLAQQLFPVLTPFQSLQSVKLSFHRNHNPLSFYAMSSVYSIFN